MKFTTSIEYAIHGLIFLVKVPAGKATLITDIAKAIEAPEAYLRKIFQQLTHGGIVNSQRGARGGFYLSREPEKISLKDIVVAIDGSLPEYTCHKDRRSCGITQNCPVKEAFDLAQVKMAEVLDATSLRNLQNDLLNHGQEANWLKVSA